MSHKAIILCVGLEMMQAHAFILPENGVHYLKHRSQNGAPGVSFCLQEARLLSSQTELFAVDVFSKGDCHDECEEDCLLHRTMADSLPFLCLMLSETFRKSNEYGVHKADEAGDNQAGPPRKRTKRFLRDWVVPFSVEAIQSVASLLRDERPVLKTVDLEAMIETVKLWNFMLLAEDVIDMVVSYWLQRDSRLTGVKVVEANKLMSFMSVKPKTARIMAQSVMHNFKSMSDIMKRAVSVEVWCHAVCFWTPGAFVSAFYLEVMERHIKCEEWERILRSYLGFVDLQQDYRRLDLERVLKDIETTRPEICQAIWAVIGHNILSLPRTVPQHYIVIAVEIGGKPSQTTTNFKGERFALEFRSLSRNGSEHHLICTTSAVKFIAQLHVSVVLLGWPARLLVKEKPMSKQTKGYYSCQITTLVQPDKITKLAVRLTVKN